MNGDDPDIYKIAVPAEWQDELAEAIRASAAESGGLERYTLEFIDDEEAASELQFDPLTVSIVIGKFVLQSAGAFLVGKAVERLLKKMSTARKADGARIIIMFPDGEIETIETADATGTAAALERLKQRTG